jgi:hypothetical protein
VHITSKGCILGTQNKSITEDLLPLWLNTVHQETAKKDWFNHQ